MRDGTVKSQGGTWSEVLGRPAPSDWQRVRPVRMTGAMSRLVRPEGTTGGMSRLVPTELTADTCCALGVHSQWCGCDEA